MDSFQRENTRETLIVEYINCLMTADFQEQPYATFAENCATKTMVKKFDSIVKCANDTEGSKLLQQMGEMTFKLMQPLKSVPTITIRETFDSAIQKRSLDNFSLAVCENLPKPMPAVCHEISSASGITTNFVLAFLAVAAALFRMF